MYYKVLLYSTSNIDINNDYIELIIVNTKLDIYSDLINRDNVDKYNPFYIFYERPRYKVLHIENIENIFDSTRLEYCLNYIIDDYYFNTFKPPCNALGINRQIVRVYKEDSVSLINSHYNKRLSYYNIDLCTPFELLNKKVIYSRYYIIMKNNKIYVKDIYYKYNFEKEISIEDLIYPMCGDYYIKDSELLILSNSEAKKYENYKQFYDFYCSNIEKYYREYYVYSDKYIKLKIFNHSQEYEFDREIKHYPSLDIMKLDCPLIIDKNLLNIIGNSQYDKEILIYSYNNMEGAIKVKNYKDIINDLYKRDNEFKYSEYYIVINKKLEIYHIESFFKYFKSKPNIQKAIEFINEQDLFIENWPELPKFQYIIVFNSEIIDTNNNYINNLLVYKYCDEIEVMTIKNLEYSRYYLVNYNNKLYVKDLYAEYCDKIEIGVDEIFKLTEDYYDVRKAKLLVIHINKTNVKMEKYKEEKIMVNNKEIKGYYEIENIEAEKVYSKIVYDRIKTGLYYKEYYVIYKNNIFLNLYRCDHCAKVKNIVHYPSIYDVKKIIDTQ